VVGVPSQLLSVGTTSSPSLSVTLTPQCGTGPSATFTGASSGCPWLSFSPAQLVFNNNDIAKTFTFVPIGIPPNGEEVYINFAVTGASAPEFDISSGQTQSPLPDGTGITIIPKLNFTPIPPIYIDGSAANLTVSVSSPTSYPNFMILIQAPNDPGVVISPNILPFSAGSTIVSSYRIDHVKTSLVDAGVTHFYKLTWSIKYQGSDKVYALSPVNIPVDVFEVRVIRYAIIPNFPTFLSLNYQLASFNITRRALADISLVPALPANLNNQNGLKVPGGRLVFDPPVLVILSNHSTTQFHVKADRLADDQAIYLRVDWTTVAHAEDKNCYLPLIYTWHIAAASSLTLSLTCLALLLVPFLIL